MILRQNCQMTANNWRVKIFGQNCSVFKINILFHFMHKFKMAPKDSGKTNFAKKRQMLLWILCR